MTTSSDLPFFFFQAEDGIRDVAVTGVQTCALPISLAEASPHSRLCARLEVKAGASLSGNYVLFLAIGYGDANSELRAACPNRYSSGGKRSGGQPAICRQAVGTRKKRFPRSEEHTSELQSRL